MQPLPLNPEDEDATGTEKQRPHRASGKRGEAPTGARGAPSAQQVAMALCGSGDVGGHQWAAEGPHLSFSGPFHLLTGTLSVLGTVPGIREQFSPSL